MQHILQGLGIVITRPQAQAKKLAAFVESAGGKALYFPLIDIAALDDYTLFDTIITKLDSYDWVIFISSNAVQNAMPRIKIHWPKLPEKCQFAAIGPVTAQALNTHGILQVLTPKDRFDSESLLSLPLLQNMSGKKVLIVRGVGGREILADTLKSRGAEISFGECYRRINPQKNGDVLVDLMAENACHALVVTSSEAMQHLLTMCTKQENLQNLLKTLPICVNHARIAENPLLNDYNVHIAHTAGDEAMLSCLIQTLHH